MWDSIRGARSRDELTERLGEEAVSAMTSGESNLANDWDETMEEESGGPFVETSANEEFADGTDESNIAEATREAFPTTSTRIAGGTLVRSGESRSGVDFRAAVAPVRRGRGLRNPSELLRHGRCSQRTELTRWAPGSTLDVAPRREHLEGTRHHAIDHQGREPDRSRIQRQGRYQPWQVER